MINDAKLDKKNYQILKKSDFFYFNRQKRALYGCFKKGRLQKKNLNYI